MNISKTLREMIQKEKMTLGQVARAIGVDRSSFYRTLRDDGNPERKTIEMVLNHLGYEIRFVKLKKKAKREKEGTRDLHDRLGGRNPKGR